MKKLVIFFLLLGALEEVVIGQSYDVSGIDDQLMQGAVAVVRKDLGRLKVIDEGKAIWTAEYAITILNSGGKKYARMFIPYMTSDVVTDIRATIYDKYGKKVNSLKKSEVQDMSADNSSFFNDSRVKVFDMQHHQYPYTFEYSYQKEINGLLFYQNWQAQPAANVATEQSMFKVIMPKELGLRYHEINVVRQVEIESLDTEVHYTWEFSNVPVFTPEGMTKNKSELIPRVFLGPTSFSMGGHQGEMSSWEGLSSWYHRLNKDRDVLPETTKNEVSQLIQSIEDPYEKVAKIYQYMQSKTRYVSLQLGIGGWQTLEASHVDELGWGDCKALTNYTKSLLQVAGIESNEALVRGGKGATPIFDDFPSSQFNHVILCVPMEQDTVWLECTSQTAPFNHLGSFTGNRKVLIVKEQGGKLVNSKKYLAEDSQEITAADVQLSKDGNAKATIRRVYSGAQLGKNSIDHYRSYSEKDQEQLLNRVLNLPDFTLNNFSIGRSNNNQELELNLTVTLEKFSSLTGKRVFLPLNIFTTQEEVPKKIENRQLDFYVDESYTTIDSIAFQIPSEYYSEYLPESTTLSTMFGEYSIQVEAKEGTIIYVRKLIIYGGEFPAEMYNEYREFLYTIEKTDKTKSVFQKKT